MNTFGVNDLVEVVDQISESAVDDLVADYDDEYTMSDLLRPDGAQRAALRYAARVELGMRTFLQDGNFGAFTTNFEDLGGLLPGLAGAAADGRRVRLWR